MAPAIIGVFIPIVMFLVIGIVLLSTGYFKFRERQMLIEKGLDAQSIKEFYIQKRDPYILMKIGIISIFFGIGLGLGLYLNGETDKDFWVPFLLFTCTGIGFVVANIAGKKLDSKKEK